MSYGFIGCPFFSHSQVVPRLSVTNEIDGLLAVHFPLVLFNFASSKKSAEEDVAEKKKLMEKGSELSPSECFPNEIWELIFVWLDRVCIQKACREVFY